MSDFTMKTYADSYLYNNRLGKQGEDAKKANEALATYMVKCARIDKTSEAFRGIIEEVKRQQRSSIFYTILMMDNVQLCVGPYELPRAFKVLDAKDPKNDKKPTIFIDVTGMIELTNMGYYICKKIDVLCAYLIDALVYLLYRYKRTKIVDNSNITIIATECYVSMFCYIIDYLRIIGFSANRNRISYYIAIYFLTNLLGKDTDDNYVKNIAMKVSGVSAAEANAIRLFHVDGMNTNIYTFVTALSESFKLKGLSLEVFITKWIYLFGTGTQYGTELLTSFLVLICNANSGAYIVNQKQVERCCGAGNLVKLFSAIEKAGIESFDMRGFRENNDDYLSTSAEAVELAKAINKKDENITVKDFTTNEVVDKARAIKENNSNSLALSSKARAIIETGLESMINHVKEGTEYQKDSLFETSKVFKHCLNEKDSWTISNRITNLCNEFTDLSRESDSVEKRQMISSCISELRQSQQNI